MFSKEVVSGDWLHIFSREALGYKLHVRGRPTFRQGTFCFDLHIIGHVVDCRGGGQGIRGLWDKVILEGEGA